MRERPDLQDDFIISHVLEAYGLHTTQVSFLPLGADVNTATYRVVSEEGQPYFLKIRRGNFDEATVAVPMFLKSLGIPSIIAPLETRNRQPWGDLGAYRTFLYPFIEGKNGHEVELSHHQWCILGAALKAIHAAQIPPWLRILLRQETYSPQWRDVVRTFLAQAEGDVFDEPVSSRLSAFMRTRRSEINHLLERADQLGAFLQAGELNYVLCHSDIHAANILIDAEDALYIVDWDNPIMAPKERDLMFFGGGISGTWHTAKEEALFYQGYGQTKVDGMALTYYRYERIVEDIAAFCQQLFLSAEGGEDREQSYRYFTGQFLPGQEVEIAYRTDERWIELLFGFFADGI